MRRFVIMDYDMLLDRIIKSAIEEDLGDGDHSTLCCIEKSAKGKAVLKVKENGIIAGVEVAEKIFKQLDPSVDFLTILQDGKPILTGDIAFEVYAPVHTILKAERLVLNCMQRMSGIATLTKKYVDKLSGYKTQLLDTRKTTPNFRLLEKMAVKIGGGQNHRFGLYDMIMLKDNHIDYCGSIEKAIEMAYQYVQNVKPELKIEVETRNIEDVKKVVASGKVDRIMLDNFKPSEIVSALSIIEGKFETEASGGINLENLEEYAATGVEYISSGAIIHHATSIDLSLKAVIV